MDWVHEPLLVNAAVKASSAMLQLDRISYRDSGPAARASAVTLAAGLVPEERAVDEDQPIESTKSIMTPYGEQDENGTDLSLIRSLLKLTPAERLRRMDAATTSALRLRSNARRITNKPT